MRTLSEMSKIKSIIEEAAGIPAKLWTKTDDDGEIVIARVYVGNGYATIDNVMRSEGIDSIDISRVKSAQFTWVKMGLEKAGYKVIR